MYKNFKVSAIILISGTGNRFNSEIPKQFHQLNDQKIYLYSLNTFYNLNIFDEIILVCQKSYIEKVKKETSKYKNIKVVAGADQRQLSSYNGLLACDKPDYVVLHDGVRPFVTDKIILDNLDAAIEHKAVNTCIKSTDTLVQIDDNNKIIKIPNRNYLRRGQTPQSFEYNLILNSHKKAKANKISTSTDDCQLVLDETNVFVVEGSITNIKITNKEDILIAKNILENSLNSLKEKNLNNTLENKVFAVIGATGGIGSEIIKHLKKEKAKVLEISRKSKYSLDLQDEKSIKKVFEKIYKEYGKIDGLINAAGHLVVQPLKKIDVEDIQRLIQVNLTGLIYSCKFAKIKENGHIINFSSSSYSEGRKDYGIYSASKAFVVNFSQSLAKENENLNVNVIAPCRTNTSMRKNSFLKEDEDLLLDPKKVAIETIKILKNNLTGKILEIKK